MTHPYRNNHRSGWLRLAHDEAGLPDSVGKLSRRRGQYALAARFRCLATPNPICIPTYPGAVVVGSMATLPGYFDPVLLWPETQ